jgi:hypothetical protein
LEVKLHCADGFALGNSMRLNPRLTLGCLILIPGVIWADATYTDRTAFATAIASGSTTLETWDELAAGEILTTYKGITYIPGNAGDQAQVTDRFLYLSMPNTLGAADAGFFDVNESLTLTFSAPINIFGINFNTFATEASYRLTANTGTGSTALSGYDPFPGFLTGEFVGLITSSNFTIVTITPLEESGNQFCGETCTYSLDNMTYGSLSSAPIPEPGSLLLLASGIAAMGIIQRRLQ